MKMHQIWTAFWIDFVDRIIITNDQDGCLERYVSNGEYNFG